MKKLLRIWYYEVMISLKAEMKTELRCNVCDETTAEKECDV